MENLEKKVIITNYFVLITKLDIFNAVLVNLFAKILFNHY